MFIGFQRRYRGNCRVKPWAYATLLVVCLALMAVLAVAQVAHTHANASDADHCALCIALHTAVPVVAAAVIIVLVEFETATPVVETRLASRYWHPQLFIRPPPSGC